MKNVIRGESVVLIAEKIPVWDEGLGTQYFDIYAHKPDHLNHILSFFINYQCKEKIMRMIADTLILPFLLKNDEFSSFYVKRNSK